MVDQKADRMVDEETDKVMDIDKGCGDSQWFQLWHSGPFCCESEEQFSSAVFFLSIPLLLSVRFSPWLT